MTNTEFYAYLEDGARTVRVFDHLWQFALAVVKCPQDLVVALTVANPKHAANYALQESAYAALDEPNPLHAAVDAAPDDATALALIEAAAPAVRAEYADDLALGAYDQEQLCARYRELILGETS